MKVFITRRIPDVGVEQLQAAGLELHLHDSEVPLAREALLERLQTGFSALLITLGETVDEAFLDAAGEGLKVIANFAVGTNNIDLAACTRRGVAVSNTPDVLSDATADQALSLMLSVARRTLAGHDLVTSGEWTGWAPTQMLGLDISGKTLGIVGMGRIGRAVAQRAQGFNMRVLYHNRSRDRDAEQRYGAQYCAELHDLLTACDVLSLHCPLTDETHHLIGAAQLARMKPTAILINTARGPVVDEAALVEALQKGQLWGAGLDVFEFEPRVTNELKSLPNVVLAPHLGSATEGARSAMAELCAEAIIRGLNGEAADHILNPEVVERR